MPEATSTTRNIETLQKIIARISTIPAVKNTGAIAGLNAVSFSYKSNVGTVFILMKPWGERKSKEEQLQGIIKQIQQKVSDIKEATVLAIAPPAIQGLGSTGGFTFELERRESTDDLKQFETVTNNFLTTLKKRPEIARAFCFL